MIDPNANRLPWEHIPQQQAAVAVERIGQALPRIFTERTVMRGPYMEDFDVFADMVISERGRYIGGPLTRDGAWDDFIQLTASWILRGCGLWTVEDQEDKTVLGFVLLGLVEIIDTNNDYWPFLRQNQPSLLWLMRE